MSATAEVPVGVVAAAVLSKAGVQVRRGPDGYLAPRWAARAYELYPYDADADLVLGYVARQVREGGLPDRAALRLARAAVAAYLVGGREPALDLVVAYADRRRARGRSGC